MRHSGEGRNPAPLRNRRPRVNEQSLCADFALKLLREIVLNERFVYRSFAP